MIILILNGLLKQIITIVNDKQTILLAKYQSVSDFTSCRHCSPVFTLTLTEIIYYAVVVPPDILDHPTSTDMVVREGSNVTLRCVASGSPAPNIIWRRESGELIPIGNHEGKMMKVH